MKEENGMAMHIRGTRWGLLKGALGAAALLGLVAPGSTLAAGAIDQEQASFGASKALIGTDQYGPDVRQAQVFMAGVTGDLDQVDLPVRVVGDPGVPLLVEIRDMDGSGLPGAVLSSFPLAQGNVPACNTAGCNDDRPTGDFSTFSFVSVPVSPPVAVTAGTQYAIVLSATGANLDIYGDMIGRTKNRYDWAGVSGGDEAAYPYGAGLGYRSDLGWYASNADRAFKTHVSYYAASIDAPINADGSSNFKAKGTVPVRFSLSLNGTATCSLPAATIAVTRTSGAQTGPVNEDTYLFAADSGSNFRIAGCQYTYNLNSKGLGSGTYLVEIRLNGRTVGSATFELR